MAHKVTSTTLLFGLASGVTESQLTLFATLNNVKAAPPTKASLGYLLNSDILRRTFDEKPTVSVKSEISLASKFNLFAKFRKFQNDNFYDSKNKNIALYSAMLIEHLKEAPDLNAQDCIAGGKILLGYVLAPHSKGKGKFLTLGAGEIGNAAYQSFYRAVDMAKSYDELSLTLGQAYDTVSVYRRPELLESLVKQALEKGDPGFAQAILVESFAILAQSPQFLKGMDGEMKYTLQAVQECLKLKGFDDENILLALEGILPTLHKAGSATQKDREKNLTDLYFADAALDRLKPQVGTDPYAAETAAIWSTNKTRLLKESSYIFGRMETLGQFTYQFERELMRLSVHEKPQQTAENKAIINPAHAELVSEQ